MAETILVFEDNAVERLLPLVYFRPVYDLRCGISTLREKIQKAYPGATLALHCRSLVAEVVRAENPKVSLNDSSPLLNELAGTFDVKFAQSCSGHDQNTLFSTSTKGLTQNCEKQCS